MPKSTLLYPIPGRFIPGVPMVEHEFESKAEADRFLEGETGGMQHASAFSTTPPEADTPAAEAAKG